MGQRWYDGSLGRFVSRDPIGFGGGPNLYGYVGQNPIKRFDPFGLDDGPVNATATWNGVATNPIMVGGPTPEEAAASQAVFYQFGPVGQQNILDGFSLAALGFAEISTSVLYQAVSSQTTSVSSANCPNERFLLGLKNLPGKPGNIFIVAAEQNATTAWTYAPRYWKDVVMEKMAADDVDLLFNLEGVNIRQSWSNLLMGRPSATDWELGQIRDIYLNRQSNTEWLNGENPFQGNGG